MISVGCVLTCFSIEASDGCMPLIHQVVRQHACRLAGKGLDVSDSLILGKKLILIYIRVGESLGLTLCLLLVRSIFTSLNNIAWNEQHLNLSLRLLGISLNRIQLHDAIEECVENLKLWLSQRLKTRFPQYLVVITCFSAFVT